MDTTGMKPALVMLIEDSEGDVYTFQRSIRAARILNEVSVMSNGKKALDFLLNPANQDKLPSIIFLDINLPLVNGFEVLKKLKADPRTTRIPVVMVTVSQEEDDIVRSYEYGAVSFVAKCISPESIIDVMSSVHGFNFIAYCPDESQTVGQPS